MLKILLLMGLFNIHTQTMGPEYTVVEVYNNWNDCALAINHTGPQNPNKKGDVKVFECVLSGDIPTGLFTYEGIQFDWELPKAY